MFKYGNPIILEGSGRIKTDPVNEKRIELVLSRFEEWAKKNSQLEKFSYAINKTEGNRSLIAFPAAGFAVLSNRYSLDSSLRLHSFIPTPNISENVLHYLLLGWAIKCMSTTHNHTIIHADSAIFGTILQRFEK